MACLSLSAREQKVDIGHKEGVSEGGRGQRACKAAAESLGEGGETLGGQSALLLVPVPHNHENAFPPRKNARSQPHQPREAGDCSFPLRLPPLELSKRQFPHRREGGASASNQTGSAQVLTTPPNLRNLLNFCKSRLETQAKPNPFQADHRVLGHPIPLAHQKNAGVGGWVGGGLRSSICSQSDGEERARPSQACWLAHSA